MHYTINKNWNHSDNAGVRRIVELRAGDTADNPASTSRYITGPCVVVYETAPDGGINATIYERASDFYSELNTRPEPGPKIESQAPVNIIVVTGFTSSADYTDSDNSRITPELLEGADVVIGIFAPKYEAIVLRSPKDVTIGTVRGHYLTPPTKHGSVTPAQYQAEIEASSAQRHRRWSSEER